MICPLVLRCRSQRVRRWLPPLVTVCTIMLLNLARESGSPSIQTCTLPDKMDTQLRNSSKQHPGHSPSYVVTPPPMFVYSKSGVFIFTAFYDSRVKPHAIRILGIHRNYTSPEGFKCEFNSTVGATLLIRATWFQIDNGWPLYNLYFAFMMVCELPNVTSFQYDAVTIVPPMEESGHVIPIYRPKPLYDTRRTLAVCVKPITGQFTAIRIVEWIELQLAAGYSNFIMYDTDLQGNSRFVLEYYQSLGIVTIIRFPFLSAILNMAEKPTWMISHLRYALYQQVYLLALQDCLYRFHPSYQYVSMIDLDEVILPKKNESINEVIRKAEVVAPDTASFTFYTFWHFREFAEPTPEISDDLYMQKTAWSPPATLDQPKSIISTDRALTVNWHVVMEALNVDNVSPRFLLGHWEHAGVHHFRDGLCSDHFHELCPNMTSAKFLSDEIRRYKGQVERNVQRVAEYLQL